MSERYEYNYMVTLDSGWTLILWFAVMIASFITARRRGWSLGWQWGWFFIAMFTGLIGFFVLLIMRDRK